MHDVACAITWARQNAPRYGGDPATVVAVGHSYAGELLLRSLLDERDAPTCGATPAEPDAYVVLGKVNVAAPIPEHATKAVPLTLLIGTLDDEYFLAHDVHDRLVAAGYDATLEVPQDVDHLGIIDTRPGVPTVDTILAAAGIEGG
jgi:hypothetical protein